MWIVQVALRRPYTFVVAALLILLATPFVLRKTPVDVFPEIDIPVVAILMSYNGLPAKEMNDRIITPIERNLANSVSDMEHTESQTLAGMGIIKVFFQPQVDQATAIAQVVASTQASLRSLPAGATPPTIIKYSATDLPVLQLGFSSPVRSEQELNEQAFNVLRTKLITIPGVAVTAPYGGRFRQVSVDINGAALSARGLSAVDVVNALNVQNLTLPSGTAKIGAQEVNIDLNGSPRNMAALGDIPITTANGATVFLRDVAQVRDGYQPQTNVVRRDGERGLLMTVLRNGGASTLDIIDTIRRDLPKAVLALPEDITVTPLADQSVFVNAAIRSVVHEALIAAALTATLLLLFLGNWRSTLIIAVSIPLSILCSLIVLHLIGQTINIMTLGGLALAVGILVDDATVEIENVERHLHMGKRPQQAILDGAAEIATPALVATLCICIAFVPMFFLTGVAGKLFVPLAQAVVFAMLASYVLSRTLVPTLVMYLMQRQPRAAPAEAGAQAPGRWRRIHLAFEAGFERLRHDHAVVLAALLRRKRLAGGVFLGLALLSCGLYTQLGRDFFPVVDAGQIRLHVRAPLGTRLEEMPAFVDQVEARIRQLVGPEQISGIVDIVGGPYTPYNTLYNNNGTFDSSDVEILVSLKPGHAPTAGHIRKLRQALPRDFPGNEFYFQPADMVSQTLNFGLSAPIDIQIQGNKTAENLAVATELVNQVRQVPGAVDTTLYQRFNRRALSLEMDRAALAQTGLVARDVAQNVMVSLSSSFQTAPTYWLNQANGTVYNVAVQAPQHEIDSLGAMLSIPVNPAGAGTGGAQREPQLLGNVVQVKSSSQQGNVSHFNIANVIDIHTGVDGRDLGSTCDDIARLVEAARARLPRGSEITVRGQITTLQTAFEQLGWGLLVAVVLVYLLLVVNFQSWLDALIIVSALPAALAGIAWMLFLSGTPLSVPALTGAIMTVGVATANSILVVAFARQRLAEGVPPVSAALEAGSTRLRPVLMTALAMVIGMVPMALGLGEGGEQNAPLGRAVIGGLLLATVSTLLFVPLVFAGVHGRLQARAGRRLAGVEPAVAV
ncbi:MAG: efflux RND transporter permease subunit [Proteobacteria bacterium]|uniref:efflux RND transporter permease subunit n=1 Tax=Aquabacterium sp. TaxID=1872578 RepID=UPI0035C697DF|nr:efflux RND transporter permease subunit [Pseudomonadota bacterium]